MAINLNLEKYGAQFKAFVDFAQSANDEDTLACIEGDGKGVLLDPEGKVRTIVAKTDDDKIKSFTKNQFFNRNDDQKALNNAVRALFKETVLKVCGAKTIDDLPPSVLNVMKKNDYGVNGGHPLSVRRILAVTDAIRVLDAGPIPIDGKAAKEICGVILSGSGVEKAKHPGLILKKRMTEYATASVQTLAAKGLGYLKGKDGELELDRYTDTFQMDVLRKFPVRFNGGPEIHTLGSVSNARDAYVDFLTDGVVKSYAKADNSTKIKANALMMLTMQGICGCSIKAVGNAFDAKGSVSRIGVGGDGGGRTDYVNVTKDEAGNITIQNDFTFHTPVLLLGNEKYISSAYKGNEGSALSYHLKATVGAESLERFAVADWKNFDRDEIMKIENDVKREHPLKAAADALPDGTKLDVAVDISFSIHADKITSSF